MFDTVCVYTVLVKQVYSVEYYKVLWKNYFIGHTDAGQDQSPEIVNVVRDHDQRKEKDHGLEIEDQDLEIEKDQDLGREEGQRIEKGHGHVPGTEKGQGLEIGRGEKDPDLEREGNVAQTFSEDKGDTNNIFYGTPIYSIKCNVGRFIEK